MLYRKKQQSCDSSRNQDDGDQSVEAVHDASMAGKAVCVASVVRRIVRSHDRREPDEIQKNQAETHGHERGPTPRQAGGPDTGG